MQILKEAFEAGGWPMYVNLFVSALVMAIIVDRFRTLFFAGRGFNKDEFIAQATHLVVKGDYGALVRQCDAVDSPLTRIVKAGLIAAPRSDEETQAAMDQASLRELPKLERRTGYLAMLANVSTLIGLFGTIVGLIHSFAAVATADPSEKAALLSRGIAEAMNNTAFGLGIAIPALLMFSLFQGRTQRLADDINEAAVTILNLVTNARRKPGIVREAAAGGR